MSDDLRSKHLVESMALLCQDIKFQEFMSEVAKMKDQSVRDMVMDEVVADPLKSAAYRGEVRAYLSLLDAHQNFLDHARQIALDSQQE